MKTSASHLHTLIAVLIGVTALCEGLRFVPPIVAAETIGAAMLILIYWIWLPAFFVASVLFAFVGHRYHLRTGLPLFHPYRACFTVLALFVAWLLAVYAWAWSWGVGGLIWLIGLPVAAVALVMGIWGYTELWRLLFGKLVEAIVIGAVRSDRFIKANARSRWGSRHCLGVLERFHAATESDFREAIKLNDSYVKTHAVLFQQASDCLHTYLAGRWAEPPSKSGHANGRMRVCRKAMTVLVTFPEHFSTAQHTALIEKWEPRFSECAKTAVTDFLGFVFKLGRNQSNLPNGEVMDEAQRLFSLVESKDRDICAHTWLALAQRHVGAQPCMDVWIWMREEQKKNVIFIEDSELGFEIVSVASWRSLCERYSQWKLIQKEEWNEGIRGRIAFLAGRSR